MIKIKDFFKDNKNIFWLFGLVIIGAVYFGSKFLNPEYTYVHIPLDDKIPFLPVFIIPYVLWYLYVPFLMLYVCLKDGNAFKKQAIVMFSGMSFCVLGFIIFPTAINFRPSAEGNGVLLRICRIVFKYDTPSANVFPSMHCLEALGAHLTTFTAGPLKKKISLRIASAVLTVLICLSTVFVKQHSVLDVFSGCLLILAIFIITELCFKLRGEKIEFNNKTV